MFVGRDEELEALDRLWKKKRPSLVTCRGRRRIGKSRLVEEFARRSRARFVKLEGKAPEAGMTNGAQLREFARQFPLQGLGPEPRLGNWLEALTLVGTLLKAQGGGRTVLLLDEISWMGGRDPGFAGSLKIAWDNALSRCPGLVVVLCGSVSSWLSENILNGTGFVGRSSLDLLLGELPPGQCAAFWGRAASRLAPREILDTLAVTGGVPRYLEEIDPGVPVEENVRRLCFEPGGPLRREFPQLFRDLFGRRAADKETVLRALADGPKNLSEIAAALGRDRSGHLSDILWELGEAGFAAGESGCNPATGAPSRQVRWRLRDNYARFYLRCIEPNAARIAAGAFRIASLDAIPAWQSVLGLQFENLVLNNVPLLLRRLGLSGTLLSSAAPFVRRADRSGRGVQIDLLLQSRRAFWVVEIKRRGEIGKEVEDEVSEKLERIPHPPGVSLRPVLVYDGHLHPSVAADGFFDAIVPASDLFGLPAAAP